MTLRRTLFLVLAAVALVPGAAAGGVRIVEREEPRGAVRSSLVRAAPLPFTMVGVHWQGPGEVFFRTARDSGAWSPWRSARPEDEDLPDLSSPESAATAGWKMGNPWWTGEARWIQYRATGEVTRLRTFFVWSPVTLADAERAAALSRSGAFEAQTNAVAAPPEQPPIVRRHRWGADESIVRAPPSFADRVRFSVVHHTAGTNSYSAAQSAAIVRGIQRYHVLSNGWNDIGYNFLVDKYGQIFEGRGGGLARNVIGAHAQGFNTGSVGVSVLGTYGSGGISAAARSAIQRLLAWRLDVAHVDPRALVQATSFGNPRFPAGRTIRLRAVSGHKDTGYTSCPGTALYGQLGAIAQSVSQIGLPKLYDPEVDGAVGGQVRFTARLSSARPWLVEVKDGAGTVVAQGSGSGTAVDWTWDATGAPVGSYTYAIRAGLEVRPATGPVPGPPPLAVTALKASPSALTPNGDWSGERTRVSFRLSRLATVGVRVENAASGALVRTLLASGARPAGSLSLTWNGRNGSGSLVADGHYRIEVSAESGVEAVTRAVQVVVDRTLGGVFASPAAVSPNGDGRADRLSVGFTLTRTATVRVQIRRGGKVVRTFLRGSLDAGSYSASWDGLRGDGTPLADGTLTAAVLASTSLGQRDLFRPARVDTVRPVVRVLSVRNVRGVARLRLSLSEPAELQIWYGRERWRDGGLIVRARPAGTQTLSWPGRAWVVRVVATDPALNRSGAVVARPR